MAPSIWSKCSYLTMQNAKVKKVKDYLDEIFDNMQIFISFFWIRILKAEHARACL